MAEVVAACLSIPAALSAYPERPIRYIVPSSPGTGPDIVARILAPELSRQMGQPFVVDNRGGGSGTIGMDMIVRAVPDGHTIGYGNILTLAINRSVVPRLAYDVDRDLLLIVQYASVPNMLAVTLSMPVKSVRELIDCAKKNPGKLRGLAVTSPKRTPIFPELPTVAEAGVPGFEVVAWNGAIAPAGVPKAVIARLNAEMNKALASTAVREKLVGLGYEIAGGTPEQFATHIRKETVKWAEVVKRAGVKID